MAEVLRNTNSPVYHQVFWKGDVLDADSLPVVSLYDITEDPFSDSPAESYYLLDIDAEKDETNIGLYAVYLPLLYTSGNATLRLAWKYEIDGEEVEYSHDVFIVTPYADIYQASRMLGVSSDPSDPDYKSYKELAAAERYARKKIEYATGQKFYLYNEKFRIVGYGSDSLPLPEKIFRLRKIYMNDVLMIDNTVTPNVNNFGFDVDISETGFALRVNKATQLDNTVYVANGMVPPSINDMGYSGPFRKDVRYRVQGKFGWEEVPDEVDLACIELMKDYDLPEVKKLITGKGGLVSLIGSNDMRDLIKLVDEGNTEAKLYLEAMAYQVAKENHDYLINLLWLDSLIQLKLEIRHQICLRLGQQPPILQAVRILSRARGLLDDMEL